MNKLFKVLASIAACILFILAIQGFVVTFTSGSDETAFEIAAFFALWVVTLVLSVLVMKLTQTLK
jgi:hypothetical protein